jgi:hypothetical protein
MTFTPGSLDDAVDGVTAGAPKLSLHTGDPGTTGASLDADVDLVDAVWGPSSSGSADSSQVSFDIPTGGGVRNYTHFGAWATDGTTFKFGGELDEAEQFSDNGGTYNFTATVTGSNPA